MLFGSINNTESIVKEIIDRITESILSGKLKPGDKLPAESELMAELGVSRNTIREAIKMLTALGVLSIKRGSGTYVSDRVNSSMIDPLIFSLIIEPKNSYELYELRVMFESGALRLCMKNSTPEDLIPLKANVAKLESMIESGNCSIEDIIKNDMEFHSLIIKATHNELVEKIGQTILALYPKYMKKSLSQANGFERALKRHKIVLDVIENKKMDYVYQTVEMTLDEWKKNWEE